MSFLTTREAQLAAGRNMVAEAAKCRQRGDTRGHDYYLRCAAASRIYASQCFREVDLRSLVASLKFQVSGSGVRS
jgi:hypothetical protein